jgi:imidazoleglycerol-phosphate dehydratase
MTIENENTATLSRKTKETDIELSLNLFGEGHLTGQTGIGFFDHMLSALSFYSQMDIEFSLIGDFQVDQHHSLEDLGMVLGLTFKKALDNTSHLRRTRYAHCYLPMDECLVRVVIDLSGRPYFLYKMPLLTEQVGTFETQCLKEFLRAFSHAAQMTLHIEGLYGENSHHLIEALFKGLGLCLKTALKVDGKSLGVNSTKGFID